jgi:hypothetical protein
MQQVKARISWKYRHSRRRKKRLRPFSPCPRRLLAAKPPDQVAQSRQPKPQVKPPAPNARCGGDPLFNMLPLGHWNISEREVWIAVTGRDRGRPHGIILLKSEWMTLRCRLESG